METEPPRRALSNDDDSYSDSETQQLVNTLYINLIIFSCLVATFELLRNMKSIYLNRLKGKFIKAQRVPGRPSRYPFGWILAINKVSHDEVLKMIGLDGYMLLRYLMLCLRIACFYSFWGLVIMMPVYSNSDNDLIGWNKYTIANIPDGRKSPALWVPVVFSYLFTIFYCQLMYFEYKNFISKRVHYLEEGDLDTNAQTYYTVMLERVPSSLRSTPMLTDFFERLFPGDIFAVEIALDLNQLDDLIEHRKEIRNKLEKAIAIWKATNARPTCHVKSSFYLNLPKSPASLDTNGLMKWMGYTKYDSIAHYTTLLDILNENVSQMQKVYFEQRQKLDELEENRLKEIRNHITIRAIEAGTKQVKKITGSLKTTTAKVFYGNPISTDSANPMHSIGAVGPVVEMDNISSKNDKVEAATRVLNIGAKLVGSGVEGLAKEGLKTAEYATKGALRGVYEATRALELLTIGAYYRTSSTAFVTFRTRVSSCYCQQLLLSHDYYMIDVVAAPNPEDIIWQNISIPSRQIEMRKSISDGTLIVGAIFWSIVVAFISAVSNLESISQEIPSLQEYSNTSVYKFFNNYLAVGILLILLSLLPFVFDFISRNYEGLKLESEIQNSIMTRYFYYQLANVFVAVGLGSIANSIHQILESPSSILSILGNSVPSFSIYFANLIITRAFTGIPIEMLRIVPLLEIMFATYCSDKKKYTRRELRNGPFADPPMVYGWIYPNILMGLMIMVTYCCIAPLILIFCALFFGLLYLMYKYQLLYVYINNYQSGGFMWYAVFDSSMVALFCGIITLICYLAIRETYVTGPFYAMLPLPVLIAYFWKHCNTVFKKPASTLSLERAKEIDLVLKNSGSFDLNDVFSDKLFRQPSLVEGDLQPAPYRAITSRSELKNFAVSEDAISITDCFESDQANTVDIDRNINDFLREEGMQGGEIESLSEKVAEQVKIIEDKQAPGSDYGAFDDAHA